MKKYKSHFSISALLLIIFFIGTACKESYTKVQKSPDVNYKLAKAIEYYNKKRYYQAIPIFEELIGLIKGDKRAEDIYYYYSDAQFQEKNYVIAAYHFKRFVELYPESKWAEEALFKYAESFSKQSPTVDLEQDNTARGIDAYQYFINAYPNSSRVPDCNKIIDKLRRKLELKALSIADLYYKTENYRAAALSYKQAMRDFPDIDEAERLTFMIVKSNYKFAKLSIINKKADRFKDVIKEYKAFIERYPQSTYKDEAAKFVEDAKYNVTKSLFDDAMAAKAEDRERIFNDVARANNQYGSTLQSAKMKELSNNIMLKAQFYIVKNNYAIAENAPDAQKKQKYEALILSYQKFIDKFADSKYKKEAEKLYNQTIIALQKLNK